MSQLYFPFYYELIEETTGQLFLSFVKNEEKEITNEKEAEGKVRKDKRS